jgi:hypothetical protein
MNVIAHDLRKSIGQETIKAAVEVTAIIEQEFEEAWTTLDGERESASFRLAALFAQSGGQWRAVPLHDRATANNSSAARAAKRMRPGAAPIPAPATPPSAAAETTPMTASALFSVGVGAAPAAFASVLRCGGGTGWSGFAKEAEQLLSDLSDSYRSPGLDSAKALQIAQSSLLLLRAVVPALSALAGAVDTTTRLVQGHGSHVLAGEIREVMLGLRRPPSTAEADGAAPPAVPAASSKRRSSGGPARKRRRGKKCAPSPVAPEAKPPAMAEVIARLANAALLDGPDGQARPGAAARPPTTGLGRPSPVRSGPRA